MTVLVEFSMSPLDKGTSVGDQVARSMDLIDRSGLPYRMNPMGTCIEGTWDECFDLIRQCYERMRQDCERITVSVKVDARHGDEPRLDEKMKSVERRVGRPLKT